MPVSADKYRGVTLYAKKKLPVYSYDLKIPIRYVEPGGLVGVIDSWIMGGTNTLHWAFKDWRGVDYYVPHDENNFIRTAEIDRIIASEQQQYEAEQEDKEIEDKGVIPYYIEKYGKVVLGVTVAVIIGKELIKKIK